MESKQVHSSHIASIGYDEDSQALHVTYKRGRPVVYSSVPPDVAKQVMSAGSVGETLHLLVRGNFPHEYKEEG